MITVTNVAEVTKSQGQNPGAYCTLLGMLFVALVNTKTYLGLLDWRHAVMRVKNEHIYVFLAAEA